MSNDSFLPPETLFLGLPACIRSELLERAAQAAQSGVDPFRNPNLTKLPFDVRTDYIVSTLELGRKLAAPYRKAASEINQQVHETLTEAQKLEKAGDTEHGISLYEKNIADGFLGTLPYERLRITYTKQKQYKDAIRVCKRYIEVLEMVRTFWPEYANLRLIPKYQEEVKKLDTKIKAKR